MCCLRGYKLSCSSGSHKFVISQNIEKCRLRRQVKAGFFDVGTCRPQTSKRSRRKDLVDISKNRRQTKIPYCDSSGFPQYAREVKMGPRRRKRRRFSQYTFYVITSARVISDSFFSRGGYAIPHLLIHILLAERIFMDESAILSPQVYNQFLGFPSLRKS